MIALRWGSATHPGVVRHANEDRFHAGPGMFVVADGMGGHAAGEVASQLAVDEFARLVTAAGNGGATLHPGAIRHALARANDAIVTAANESEACRGMGTTLVGLALVEDDGRDRLLAFNLGDSRLYRVQSASFEQLSVDHSQAQELVEAGVITAAERKAHPLSNVLTRALGHGPYPRADYWLLDPHPGDRFLLCSDGLYAELTDDRIRLALIAPADPERVAADLVQLAVEAGGRDNITTVVVDVG
jgi:protein phosphatase